MACTGLGHDLLDVPRDAQPGEVTLKDKKVFEAHGQAFLDFIGNDSKLVIHNAKFDMKFLNAELSWMNLPEIPMDRAVDTLGYGAQQVSLARPPLWTLCAVATASTTPHGHCTARFWTPKFWPKSIWS